MITAAMLAAPMLVLAQDTRIDEGPEKEPGVTSATPPAATRGLLPEPALLSAMIDAAFDRYGDTGTPRNGFYAELSNMITGSGWVSLGPGYRRYLLNDKAFIDASAAVSWRAYNMMQTRFEMPQLFDERLSVGAQLMWQDQTQINYFGIGPHSLESRQSQYQMQSIDSVVYSTLRFVPSLALAGEFGFLRRPDIMSPGGTFKPDLPTTTQEFPNNPGVSDPFQPNYLHTEVSLTSDTRNYRSFPTSGHVLRAQMTSFWDQSTSVGQFTFRQYEAEAVQFIPMTTDRNWVLAFRGWLVWSDVPAGNQVPFYLLPSLGGNNSLRSFADYRFHDQNLVLTNMESRWGLWTHLDVAAFLDAGNVGARVSELNFDKVSVGGGLRLHTQKATFARLDIAYGAEGWNFVFRTSDPLRLARLTRRVAAVPFVP
jgi:outer membrane protein assembly factor BamA